MNVAYTFSGYGIVPARRRLMVADIKRIVAEHYGLDPAEMNSPCRERRVARPRQVVMWLARRRTERTLHEIGDALGRRDHTTILHGIRTIERLIESDPELAADTRAIIRELEVRA